MRYAISIFFLRYEWIVPIQWMKNGMKQDMYWLENKNGKQRHQTKNKNMMRYSLRKDSGLQQI